MNRRIDPTQPGSFIALVSLGINPNAVVDFYKEVDALDPNLLNEVPMDEQAKLIKSLSDGKITPEGIEIYFKGRRK